MHLSNAGGFTLELIDYFFLIGMVWALLRILFSNTWVAAASHGAYNFLCLTFLVWLILLKIAKVYFSKLSTIAQLII
ncbi:hypothetical protein NWO25_04140 [Enterococcus lactis]|nr:hypothetical protein [Enterococcus lactis]